MSKTELIHGNRVFIPGCALASYNPKNVQAIVKHLNNSYENFSVIQKCCGKPTKALGQVELFEKRFNSLKQDIQYCKADEVILACQSCMKVLEELENVKTSSLWEVFPIIGLPKELIGKAKNSDVIFSIHDSCSVRDKVGIHDGIRWILNELGYKTAEAEQTRDKTRCCGFGGMVGPANPDVVKRVMERRVKDFPTNKIVTYCAACRQSMALGGGDSWHILDLIFGEVVTSQTPMPKDTLSNPMNAWSNRFKSKMIINNVMR